MFISYARADGREFAERLHDALEGRGMSAWYDQRDLDENQDFTAAIEDAIEDATHVVVCITRASKGSASFVRREIEYAILLNKPIVPVRVERIPPQIHIATISWIDFFTGWDAALDHLIKRLASPSSEEQPSKAEDRFRPHLESLSQFVIGEIRRTVLNVDAILQLRTSADAVQPRLVPIAYQSRAPNWFDHRPTEPSDRSFSSFAEAFQHHGRRVVLLGQPGAGKSTALYAFARSTVTDRLADPQELLPVFAPIRTWDGQSDLVTWLAGVTGLAREALREELARDRVLLLLDGLDELRGSGLSTSDTRLRTSFMQELNKLGDTATVVTSRVEEWDELVEGAPTDFEAPATVRLLSIDDDRIAAYLGDDQDLRSALAADDELRELARNPLVLTLFALAYRDQGDAARQLRDFASSPTEMRAQVFSRYIARRFEYEESRAAGEAIPGPSLDDLYGFLSECALGLLDRFQRVVTESSGGRYTATQTAGQTVDLVDVSVADIRRAFGPPSLELIAFAERLQLLISSTPPAVRFVHLLMRDFFAVPRAIAQLGGDDLGARRRAAGVLGLIADPRGFEPLVVALADQDAAVRTRVLWALGELRDPAAIGPVSKLLERSKAGSARQSRTTSSPDAETVAFLGDDETALHALTMSFGMRALARIGGDDAQRVVEDLLPRLRGQDPLLLMEWMSTLARFGVSGVPPLLWAVESDYFAQWAAEALGEIGDASATDTLIAALDDENIADEVEEALGRIGDAKAVPALASRLAKAWSEDGVGALASIGGSDGARALASLMADPDPSHRTMVAEALGHVRAPDAVSTLIEAAKDPDIRVRCAAADALEQLDYDRARVERLRPSSTDLVRALRNGDASFRQAVAQLLGARLEPGVADALVGLFVDPDADVRRAAMLSLARHRDPRAVRPLLELLFSESSELAEVDPSIAWALGLVGTPEAADALATALDESEDNQGSVVEGLIRIGPNAVAPLVSILKATDPAFQVSIARVLVAIGPAAIADSVQLLDSPARSVAVEILKALGEPAEQAVLPLLTSHAAAEREAAASVLQGVGTVRSLEPLVSLLADTNMHVRTSATDALIAIGEPVANHLLAALADDAHQVRAASARALGEIGLHRAAETLIAALEDPDPGVRYQALIATAQVAGFVPADDAQRLLADPDVVVRRMAAELLGTDGTTGLTDAETRELTIALGQANRELAAAAGAMLAVAGEVAALVQVVLDPDPLARDAARAMLSADAETIAALRALQKGASREQRFAIAQFLASLGDPKAINALVASLDEDSLAPGDPTASILLDVADASVPVLVRRMTDTTRGHVYAELIARSGAIAVDHLIAQLLGHDVEKRTIAGDLLVRIGRPAVGPLIEILGNGGKELEARLRAIGALANIDHPRASAALATVADAHASYTSWLYPIALRLAAVDALSRSMNELATAGLKRALVSPERRVRSAAKRRLRGKATPQASRSDVIAH